MSQPDNDLLAAAKLVIAQLDGALMVCTNDEPALLLRCAVQAVQLATLREAHEQLLVEADELARANKTLREQAERDRIEKDRLVKVVASYHAPEVQP